MMRVPLIDASPWQMFGSTLMLLSSSSACPPWFSRTKGDGHGASRIEVGTKRTTGRRIAAGFRLLALWHGRAKLPRMSSFAEASRPFGDRPPLRNSAQQTDDEESAEYEAGRSVDEYSIMVVPTKLVPEVRRLIARWHGA